MDGSSGEAGGSLRKRRSDLARERRRQGLVEAGRYPRIHSAAQPRKRRDRRRPRPGVGPRRRKVLIYLVLAIATTALTLYSFVERKPDLGLIFAFMGGFALTGLARLRDESGGTQRWKTRSYLLLAVIGGCFVIYGLYRLVAFGEQQPARFLGVFGGLGSGLALSAWADLRSEATESRNSVQSDEDRAPGI